MANFPAHTEADRFRSDILAPYPGRAASLSYAPAQPPARPDFRNVAALAIDSSVGSTFAVGPGSTPPVAPLNDLGSAFLSEDVSIGGNWFDKVHLIPRTHPSPTFTPIDFGNIVSTVQDTFELFSAFRTSTVRMTVFTNNVVGVEVPDLPTVPFDMDSFTSVLDPASTRLNPLALVVQAIAEGPATFNNSLDFSFNLGAGTRMLFVQGNRIALVLVEPTGGRSGGAAGAGGFVEILEFATDVLPVLGGKEQRISYRDQPRQILEWNFLTETVERQLMQALLFDWQFQIFAVPVWWEQVRLTTAIAPASTNVAVTDDLTFVDMRVGELAVIVKDRKTFDVLEVVSKTANSITLESTIQNGYDVGDLVIPIRLCHAQPSIAGTRFPVTVEAFKVRFRCISNAIGEPTPSTAAFGSYLGKVLFDDCNLLKGNMAEQLQRRTFIIDNESGLVTQESPWDHGKRKSVKGFLTRSRQELFEMRQVLYALNGRQISFYMPTNIEDLTVTQDLVIGQAFMDIDNIGYTRFIQSREQKATFRITFTDGTFLERIVQSSTELGPDEERLVLDLTWPASRTVSEIKRIEFYELSRFDTDSLRIQHSTIIGRTKLFAPIATVNDLD